MNLNGNVLKPNKLCANIINMLLQDIPVVFICPSHNEKYMAREKHMWELLTQLGFKQITHYKSSSEAYPTCLLNANIDILSKHLNNDPVIILEDDIELYNGLPLSSDIDIPDDTDAFYLGFSKCGGSYSINLHDGDSIIEHVSEYLIRIKNMLSAHAILYKSCKYKERVIQELTLVKDMDYHQDVVFSRLHMEFNIYGFKFPFFYQSVKYDNVQYTEDMTNFDFHTIVNIDVE